ncbi:MAG TPA: protocatechuate 3,4-dioxygenase subunit beta [Candidatus Binataceae bacterium]|jgi:protocatechuate 3,4-dioxygenase beta subunit|nr:protocatechuate 3,4-dioxygenase subunit beta [Candidatus Binataceae bacterium]
MNDLPGYRRPAQGVHPPYDHAAYESTRKRAPRQAPIRIAHTLSEITGPALGAELVRPGDADLTHFAGGEALGERIIVTGRVLDEDGRPQPNLLIEIWQANAAGRYLHEVDQHDAPLDPHFTGVGRVATDPDGVYRFITIKPGAYPWKNHYNAWRPNHIHFSLFGPGLATRLVTQMYFPGDPLLRLDPIFNSIPDSAARERLVAAFDIEATEPGRALGYRFDFVLRGRHATPMED